MVVRNNRAWGNSTTASYCARCGDSIIEEQRGGRQRARLLHLRRGDTPPCAATSSQLTVGVHLSAGSTRNEVEGNDFIGNREQVRYVGATSAGAPTAITGTPWAGIVTATAWAMCPTKSTTRVDRDHSATPPSAAAASPAVQARCAWWLAIVGCACPPWWTPSPTSHSRSTPTDFQRDTDLPTGPGATAAGEVRGRCTNTTVPARRGRHRPARGAGADLRPHRPTFGAGRARCFKMILVWCPPPRATSGQRRHDARAATFALRSRHLGCLPKTWCCTT